MRFKKSTLEVLFIGIVLFAAIFNDIVRIPNTSISLFRMLLPLVLVLGLYHINKTYRYFLILLLLLISFIIQNVVFYKVLKIENSFDYMWFATYVFHYISIILIFMLVRMARAISEDIFEKMFEYGMPLIGILCVIAFYFAVTESIPGMVFANRNNYACCLAAMFPWFLIRYYGGRRRYSILIIAILSIIWWGDSKSAFVGILIEIALITLMKLVKVSKEGDKLVIILLPVAIGIALGFALSPVSINGYVIREMFIGMVTHIVKGELYPNQYSSLYFRTNAIIVMLAGMLQSFFIGIGPGNSGKYLRYHMEEMIVAHFGNIKAVSPHNAWLEFWLDCGFWAILVSVYIFIKAIKLLYRSKELSDFGIYFVAFTISFPLWVMSASGIYTIFLLFIIISCLYEYKDRFILADYKKLELDNKNERTDKKLFMEWKTLKVEGRKNG